MPKIKNIFYKKFIEEGFIETITEQDIKIVLDNIRHRLKDQIQSLIILLYYTGARPSEILELKGSDIIREPNYIVVKLKTFKKGLPRTLYLAGRKPFVNILRNYSYKVHPDVYAFWMFRCGYKVKYINKKGDINTNLDRTAKLRYFFKRWFSVLEEKEIPAYYLRHNRFSIFAQKGASIEDIRLWKGGKTLESVTPYLHMTTVTSRKLSRLL